MDISIRRADVKDSALLSALSATTFLETFRGTCTDEDIHGFVKTVFDPGLINKELQDPFDFYFIAFIDTVPVGYIRMKEELSDVPLIRSYRAIELKRIYVLKMYHDRKAGATLMQFALRFAADNDYEAVWLGVWEHNERAKSFYKKWGFIDTGFTHDFPIGSTPQTDQWLIKVLKE